MDEDVCL
jgi:hypothetical protein